MRTMTQLITSNTIKFLDDLCKFFDQLFFNDLIKTINSCGIENYIILLEPIIVAFLIDNICNLVPKILILLSFGYLYASLLRRNNNIYIKRFAIVLLLFFVNPIGGSNTEICMKLLTLLSAFMCKWNYDNFIKKNRRSVTLICVIAVATLGSYNVNSVFVTHAFLTVIISSFEFTFLSVIIYTVMQLLIVIDLHKMKLNESNTHVQSGNVSNE